MLINHLSPEEQFHHASYHLTKQGREQVAVLCILACAPQDQAASGFQRHSYCLTPTLNSKLTYNSVLLQRSTAHICSCPHQDKKYCPRVWSVLRPHRFTNFAEACAWNNKRWSVVLSSRSWACMFACHKQWSQKKMKCRKVQIVIITLLSVTIYQKKSHWQPRKP